LAAYHSSNQEACEAINTPIALLPLFHESAHTVTMIRHSKDVVRNATEHLNLWSSSCTRFWSASECSCKADTVEVVRNTWRRQTGGDIWRLTCRDGSTI